ncbi:mitochondrial 37S ribosomal protein [Martiniozyma asiatica (nom. inval.)]|nr:mitochondrial 37S ribosomal protein [Martiniozyma asiatica]
MSSALKYLTKQLATRAKPMKRFPEAVALPSTHKNVWVLRDNFKRQMFKQNEVTTRALKFIARNNALPQKVRLEAQIQLTTMPYYTRSTQISNRCVDSGRGKGIIRDFRLCRYQFRMQALQGLLPGVRKGVW